MGDKKYGVEDIESISWWIEKEGKTEIMIPKANNSNYYMLRIENSSLLVEETFLEVDGDERYIILGEADPHRYSEIVATAIIQEFSEFKFVKVSN